MYLSMGKVIILPFFCFLVAALVATSQGSHLELQHQILHLLLPKSGIRNNEVAGLSCLSWRLGVETNNIRGWSTVPEECEGYVGHYLLGDQYRKDSAVVAKQALVYFKSLNLTTDGRDIWVFDIDETSLSNLPYYAKNGFGTEPYNSTSFDEWVMEGKTPALPETLKLYKQLVSLGLKIVFLTGRTEDQRDVTATNLKNVGFHTWTKLICKNTTLYPSGTTAVVYKSNERRKLVKRGYKIIGNMGDQWSDILGNYTGGRTFKLPDPLYYIS